MNFTLHCFGASTTSGEALRNLAADKFFGYSRSSRSPGFHYTDLRVPDDFIPISNSHEPSIWISFVPFGFLLPFRAHLTST